MSVSTVQHVIGVTVNDGDVLTLPSPAIAGNIVVVYGLHSYAGCPPSVSNSESSTVTTRISTNAPTRGPVRVATMVVGANGTYSITAHMACGFFRLLIIEEVSGADPAAPIETTAYDLQETNSTSAMTVGPVTVANHAGLRAWFSRAITGYTGTSGWTAPLDSDGIPNYLLQGKQATAAGSVSATIGMTNAGSDTVCGMLFSILPLAAPAPTISVTTQPRATQTAHASNTVSLTSTDTTDNSSVWTASLIGGGTLSGTTTATTASGATSFPNLIPTGVGSNRQYQFTDGTNVILSNAFDVTTNAETTLHRSDFTAANGTPVTSQTPTIGTALRSLSPFDGEHSYANASSGTASVGTATGNFTNQTLPADVTVRARTTLLSGDANVRGLWARAADISNLYLAQFEGGGTLSLYKCVAGTYTSIASASVSVTIGTPFTFALVAAGSRISAWFNGAEVCYATDATFTAAGFAGYVAKVLSVPATDSNGNPLDYFEVTAPATSGGASALLLLSAYA